ncbi:MAG: response regulator transcription factor [Clostridiales bacterium]|nr:response regulator transcription factor [Clostridiales bacterium]
MDNLIYVIEDEENIRELIRLALESYSYKVETFETAEDGLAAINSKIPDLAIFDIMLPKMDGVTAVKLLRKKLRTANLPIIFLTAKGSEIDKVVGLDSGADDYIAKPFGVLELSARVRSLLRRSHKNVFYEDEANEEENIVAGNVTLDVNKREFVRGKTRILLTPKEFNLLSYLILNKEKAISREELLSNVWHVDFIGDSRTLDMHVRSLRQKLGAENAGLIKTVRGIGYRFVIDD